MVKKAVFTVLSCATMLLADNNTIIEKLNTNNFFKDKGITVKQAIDLGDTWQLKIKDSANRTFKCFLTKDNKTIIFGEGYSVDTNEPLEIPIENIQQYKQYASFIYGNGPSEYYVFTDPECPYCKKFEKEWSKISSDVKLYVYLVPLAMHKEAIPMIKYVLSQKDNSKKGEALLVLANGGGNEYKDLNLSKETEDKIFKIIDKTKEIQEELDIRGTPAVIDSNGKMVSWVDLIKQFADLDIDAKAIEMIEKNNLAFKAGKKGGEKLYMFADLSNATKQYVSSDKFKKLLSEKELNIVLTSNDKNELKEIVKILNSENNQYEQFLKTLDGKSNINDEPKNIEKGLEKTAMITMLIQVGNINKFPSIYNSRGKNVQNR